MEQGPDYSGGYNKYPILCDRKLPDEVRDEVCNDCPGNDSGKLFNPEYNPKLKAWLESVGLDSTQCYIIWFSW